MVSQTLAGAISAFALTTTSRLFVEAASFIRESLFRQHSPQNGTSALRGKFALSDSEGVSWQTITTILCVGYSKTKLRTD
jgi:hypothetical protein